MNQNKRGSRTKRPVNEFDPVDLATKVAQSEPTGFALNATMHLDDSGTQTSRMGRSVGMYSQRTESNRPKQRPKLHMKPKWSKPSSTSVMGFRTVDTGSTRNGASNVANHIVCAISENLARETCVCSLDAASPTSIQVSKQGNGLTYAETLAYLEILKPDEVVLNEGRRNSQLARKVLELFNQFATLHDEFHPSIDPKQNHGLNTNDSSNEKSTDRYGPVNSCTVVKFISRAYFDQTKGAEILRRVSREETYEQSALEEYILLSSAHALIHYTQQCLGASFARKSVCFNVCCGGKKRMTIDRSSLLQLEILVNSKTGKTKDTLIGTIDCTKTVVGSRLLRSSLMAPSTRTDTINARLDLVDVFLGDEDFFYAVLENLKSLPEVDRMLSNIALVPPKNSDANSVANQRIASKGISALVCIKSTLQALPPFAKVLQMQIQTLTKSVPEDEPDDATLHTGCSSLLVGIGGGEPTTLISHHLLRAIHFAMSQPSLCEVLEAVTNVFTESTTYSRNANAMRHQECFALKCEETGMMSVLRKAFLANVDDIYRKADEYAGMYGFPVSVRYSTGRGYFLGVPVTYGSTLPTVFLQPSRSGRFVTCTTEEITSLNSRAQDNVHDILLMTLDRIHEVLDFVRLHYDSIASLCDAVALLDMCHSFADHVTLNALPWSRPKVVDGYFGSDSKTTSETNRNGTLVIRCGRYSIDIDSGSPRVFVPNDTYAADGRNFTVITGINGSGKTTYLRQIAMVVILAQCGSYVPAEAATIPIRDRLCCRIGYADDTEHNLSTFMLEMKETAFICNNASEDSLILIDELGRATSNEEGIAIAWAVSEFLLTTRAITFFVSHYPLLARLAEMYPSVQNVSLEATILRNEETEITYSHKVKAGACSACKDYGVEMAAYCGWPQDVIANARIIEKEVERLLPSSNVYDKVLSRAEKPNQIRTGNFVTETYRRIKTLLDSNENRDLPTTRLELSALRSSTIGIPLVDCDSEDAMKTRKQVLTVTERGIVASNEYLAIGISSVEEKETDFPGASSIAKVRDDASKDAYKHDIEKASFDADSSSISSSSGYESSTESSGHESSTETTGADSVK